MTAKSDPTARRRDLVRRLAMRLYPWAFDQDFWAKVPSEIDQRHAKRFARARAARAIEALEELGVQALI